MPRSEREMQGVTGKTAWHDLLLDVVLRECHDFRGAGEEIEAAEKIENRLALVRDGMGEFIEDGVAGYEFVFTALGIPECAGPIPTCDHLGLRARLVIEARDGGLDVHTGFHDGDMLLRRCTMAATEVNPGESLSIQRRSINRHSRVMNSSRFMTMRAAATMARRASPRVRGS